MLLLNIKPMHWDDCHMACYYWPLSQLKNVVACRPNNDDDWPCVAADELA